MRSSFLGSIIVCLCLAFSLTGNAQFYTGSHQDFGKNRVQYKGFEWRYHNYTSFKVYYYSGGENFAVFAAQSADKHLSDLRKFFDFNLNEKIEILVFNRQSDFKMSNIGVTEDENTNIGGNARIVGSKIFLYYEGQHDKFDQQIRSSIAEIIVEKMMYGDNYKDAIKTSTFLALPSWYVSGFLSYVGTGWNTEIDSRVKDGILSGRYTQFNKLEGPDLKYAGHSFWNYIAERYGDKVIPQIFYMTRLSRNVESGFMFVLGINLNTLANDYINYYKSRYLADNQTQQDIALDSLPIKNKKKAVYTQFKVSPDGRYAAYVSNQMGQYKIWMYDMVKKKVKRIYKKDYKLDRITDYSYPVINWHPKVSALAFFEELKGQLNLNVYTVDDGKTIQIPILQMEKVLDFDYSDDGTSIVFSGVIEGKTDLYLYKVAGRSKTQLTNDLYDDMNPRFIDNSSRIIFSSNRLSDTLSNRQKREDFKPWESDYDIFVYDLNSKPETQVLQRITDTPESNEFQPQPYVDGGFTYLSDRNGIYNRYVATYDSTIAYIDTAIHYRYFAKEFPISNYRTNILQYDCDPAEQRATMMTFENGRYNFYVADIGADRLLLESDLTLTNYKATANAGSSGLPGGSVEKETIRIKNVDNPDEINIDHYQFEDDPPEFEKEVVKLDKVSEADKEEQRIKEKEEDKIDESQEFKIPGYIMYKTNFTIDNIVTQVDNSFLFKSYQRYAGMGAVYFNPGFSGLIKMGVSDLFEDHKVVGGFRIPLNFNSGEYLLTYDNLKGWLDHKFVFYRNSFQAIDQLFNLQKVITTELRYRANFPFDVVQSLRTTIGYRNDQTISQAIDQRSLNEPDAFFNMVSGKVEYVFDAVLPKGLNLYNGTRFKVFGELYKELNEDKANIYIAGADFRHYQKIHKDIIYAGRFASSYSFGSKRVAYYLGGVDNWIFRREVNFDPSVQLPTDQEFAFQTIGTPMRGFIQNIRNGTNFAVINNEVRIPIVKVLSNKPIKSDFLENFMVVGFSDIGSAWTGAHPYSKQNSFNTIIIDDANIFHIELENLKDPIVYGYGFGLRSRLFGYYVRFDWAWGVDDGTRQESIRYLSLTLDF